MNVISILRQRRIRRAFGALSVASSLLAGSALYPTTLLAKLEAPAVQATQLEVPRDITEAEIEEIDVDLAKVAGPLLQTLFDAGKPVDDRRKAATELRSLANNFSAATPEKDSLRRRLQRRVALMSAAIEATESSDVSGSSSSTDNLGNTASSTVQWLSSIANGATWISYLHLDELQKPEVSADVLKQTSRNLTLSDSMDPRMN